jgi:3-hydroxyisobutyrate dehydrogenase-like beta-hydroxyacid dehydrogenase
MSTTNTQPAVGFIGPGDQGLPMATAIAVAGYPLVVWACHPGPLSLHLPRRRRPGERLRASVVEVLEISQAEQESRKSGARGTLNF